MYAIRSYYGDIGKQGVEKYYEDRLHGHVGYQEVEVNNRGRIIRTLKYQPPVAGQDIYLNIDIRLQMKAQELLAGRRGGIVLMDPRDGAVLALASSPSYDPNLFVLGMLMDGFSALLVALPLLIPLAATFHINPFRHNFV